MSVFTTTTSPNSYLLVVLLLICYNDRFLLAKSNKAAAAAGVIHDEKHHTLSSMRMNRDESSPLMKSDHLVENKTHPHLRLVIRPQLPSDQKLITTNTTSTTTTITPKISSISRQLEEDDDDDDDEERGQSGGAIHINSNNKMMSSISSEVSLLNQELIDETCQQLSPMSPWHYTNLNDDTAFINYQQYSDFLEGPGISNNDIQFAVCEFHPLLHYQNYAHAMQQILRCFSWFTGHPNVPRRLMWRNDTFFHNFVTDNIVSFLGKYYKVKLIHDDPNHIYDSYVVWPKADTGLLDYAWDGNLLIDFAMLSSDHATEFKNLFYDRFRLHEDDPGSTVDMTTVGCTTEKRHPRIGILNRSSLRHHNKKFIMNDKEIYEAIHEAFPDVMVELLFFDEMSFAEQIIKMMSVDIVLSTHGSQLQHLMFMPSQGCSSVTELLFPEYFVPDFFGSLCKVFNIQHSFFYMDNHDLYDIMESDGTGRDTTYHRVISPDHKENVHFCLDSKKLLPAVSTMLDNWYSCCDNLMKT